MLQTIVNNEMHGTFHTFVYAFTCHFS